MTRKRMDRTGFYILAVIGSVFLATVLTALADSRSPLSLDDASLLGLLAFFFIVTFNLFVMYDVWSMRGQKEGWAAARILAGFAVGGLVLASVVGLTLRFFSRFPLEAFLGSYLIVQVIESSAFRWINRRDPNPIIPKWTHGRFMAVLDVLLFFLGLHLLIDVWQESRMAAAVGMAGALTLMLPSLFGRYREWRALRSGPTPDSIPPSVTQ